MKGDGKKQKNAQGYTCPRIRIVTIGRRFCRIWKLLLKTRATINSIKRTRSQRVVTGSYRESISHMLRL